MRNHTEKYKDMTRSALPSIHRHAARAERRAIHRSHRRQIRIALDECRRTPDHQTQADLCATPDRRLRDMVLDRQAYDNLSALLRWSVRRVERDPRLRDDDLPGQLAAFRRLLPGDLAGRHALGHIRYSLDARYYDSCYYSLYHYSSPARPAPDLDRRRAQALAIIETGRHKQLNVEIRKLLRQEAAHPEPADLPTWRRRVPTPDRLLLGQHDVDAFVRATATSPAIATLLRRLSQTRVLSWCPTQREMRFPGYSGTAVACKHGISRSQVRHVVERSGLIFVRRRELPGRPDEALLFLGDAADGTSVEVLDVLLDDGRLRVVHAMAMRASHRPLYEEARRWRV